MAQQNLFAVVDGKINTDLKCNACELSCNPKLVTNRMEGFGSRNPDFLVYGFAPGRDDDLEGRPMVGMTGALFWQILAESGIARDRVFVSNLIKCAPFQTKLKDKHFKACQSHLLKEINLVKPKALIALGQWSTDWLTGIKGLKGLKRRGIPCRFRPEILVFSVKHPGSILRRQGQEKTDLKIEIREDFIWLRKKAENNKLGEADETVTDYKVARTLEDVKSFVAELMEFDTLACDIETNMEFFPEDGNHLIAIGFSAKKGHGRAIPLDAEGLNTTHYWEDGVLRQVRDLIRPLLSKTLFGHNFIQFDQKGINWFWDLPGRLNIDFDTMFAHYLLDETVGMQNLEQIAMLYTSMPPWKKNFTLRDTEKLGNYLCMDVDATWRIREALESELSDLQRSLLNNLMFPAANILHEMELHGVYVHKPNLFSLSTELHSRIESETRRLRLISEVQAFEFNKNIQFNIRSQDHIREIMEEYLKLPCIERTEGGLYCTDSETLEGYKDVEFVSAIQQIRGLTKLQGTYVDGILERIRKDGRIHTTYPMTATVTGRLASRNPNLQNIAGEDKVERVISDGSLIKGIFSTDSDDKCLLAFDYSQVEYRILAIESRDPGLIDTFRRGLDVHTATAALVYKKEVDKITKGDRVNAKRVNFGIVYGLGDEALQAKFVQGAKQEIEKQGRKITDAEAKKAAQEAIFFKKTHQEQFPHVWAWLELQALIIKTQGYQETRFGRRRRYPDGVDERAIRQAQNFVIQSEASDITMTSLVKCSKALKELGLKAVPILTVHDSIIFECPIEEIQHAALTCKTIMENPNFDWLTVPLKVDCEVGKTWGSMKKYDVEAGRLVDGNA
jgi:DNA polymerase-1